ncbi:MAG: hypothetical protein LBI01_06100, partial [Elusimicrobium sp.]|nr:hypothetical protein [Elusimicrobium sp.]
MRKNNISDIIKKFTAAAVSASLLFSVCPAELLAGTPQFEKQAAETLRQISAEQKHYQDMIKREEQKQSDYYRSSKRESGVKRYNSMLPGVGVKKMLMTDSQTQKYIEVLKYDDKLRKDDVFRRAEEIKNTLLEWEENPEDAANQGPYTFEEFQAKYNQSVKEQEKKLLAQINKFEEDQKKDIEEKSAAYARYNEYTPQMVASWRSIIESSLSKAVSEMKQDLASAKQNSLSKVQPEYRKYSEDFKTESSMQEQRFFEALKALVQELMDLFNKYPEKIEPYVIELSPVLLVADGQQNIVFTRAQKDMLLRLYKNFIKTKDEDCDKWGICDLQVNALSGIGMLGKYSDDANAITDFIESHEKDPAYSKILITGAAALLAMDDYGRLNSYLERVSRRESKTDFDMLSFSNSTDAYNVRNGNYLGEVSKYAAYRENGGLDNAYTQIAIMLAQKNTQGSLSILENQGVNKCAVYTVYEDSDSKQPDQMRMAADPLYTGAVVANTIYNTKKQQKIECYGILPFLDGALLSGLSGADKYDPPYSVAGQQNMWQAGLTTVTPQEAANSQRAAQNMKWAFSAYAADRKISKEAALALYIINQDMGDLDVQSEQYIDEQLYAKYKNELSSPGLLNEFAIIKDLPANIQKKNSRLAAAKIRSKIAAGADIAVTAWCLYDMSKLAVKGGRAVTKLISGGGSKAWRIAEVLYYGRGGNTVRKMAFLRENVAMYKKVFAGRKNPSLIVKVGERIRNGMEPVFLEQSKQYGALPYKTGPRSLDGALKPDNVETILKHTSFNGEEFIIDSRSVYKEINGAKNLESDIIGVEKVLKDGIKNTPEKFGKYSMSARPITGSGAVSKRPVLNNLKTNYNNFLGNEILASDAEKALLSAGVANLETAENFAAGIRNSGALPLKAAKYSDKLLNTKFARGEANHLKLFNIYKKTHETTNGEKVLLEEPVKIEKTVKGVRVLLDEPINGINHSFWDWRIFDPLKDTKFIKNKRLPNISSVALNQETGFLEFVGTN